MSIERKDTKLENAERSSKLFTLSLRENDHIKAIADSVKTLKIRYIEYAKDLALRIDLKDEKLEITKYYQIAGYIRNKLRLEGIDENKIHYVNDCLEEYPEYKDHRYNKLTKGSVNPSLENLSFDNIVDVFENEQILKKMALEDTDNFRDFMEGARSILNKGNSTARICGITDIPHGDHVERHKKISTPRLEPGESRMHFTGVQLKDSLFSLAEHFSVLLERMNQYPPKDDEFDRHITVRFGKVKKMVDSLDRYIQVLGDERYLFSPVQMTVIDVGKETIGIEKHPDSLGSKITTLDDQSREMTDKNIRIRKQNYDELLDEFNNSVMNIEKMIREMVYDLSQWNDIKSDHAKAKATRQDNLSDHLSEKA